MGRSSTAAHPRTRDAETKLAQSRLSVLELARELGNVAEACRQRGLDRTSFYEWKRRFQMQGFEGLKDLPPIHRSHPQTTPEPVVKRITDLALEHPATAATAMRQRWLWRACGSRRSPSRRSSTTTASEPASTAGWRWRRRTPGRRSRSPRSRPRSWRSSTPAFGNAMSKARLRAIASADTFFVGSLKGVGKVYLHAVVDTFGSYAFGFLHVSKQPEAAVAVLHNDVLPFYRNLDLPVGAILTDNGREFCADRAPPLRALPRPERHRAPPHKGPNPQDQRLRGAVQRHRPRRVLPGEDA